MPYADRDQQLAYLRDYRAKNPDGRSRTAYQQQRREAVRQYIREQKRKPCTDCGGLFPPCVMDFDHLPEHVKFKRLSELISRNASLRAVQEEIAKCELVCANCHRIRSWRRQFPELEP